MVRLESRVFACKFYCAVVCGAQIVRKLWWKLEKAHAWENGLKGSNCSLQEVNMGIILSVTIAQNVHEVSFLASA